MLQKKFVLFCLFGLLFLWANPLPAEVISIEQKDLYAVQVLLPKEQKLSLPYILTDFGPGNIHFLERVDIVLDQEGRIGGLNLVYTTADGFRRHVFLRDILGWSFCEIKPGSKGKRVTIRVITSQDLDELK